MYRTSKLFIDFEIFLNLILNTSPKFDHATIQLVQFASMAALSIVNYRTGCDYPEWMYFAAFGYIASFLTLYGNFYIGRGLGNFDLTDGWPQCSNEGDILPSGRSRSSGRA